jgi:hypothetical protein
MGTISKFILVLVLLATSTSVVFGSLVVRVLNPSRVEIKGQALLDISSQLDGVWTPGWTGSETNETNNDVCSYSNNKDRLIRAITPFNTMYFKYGAVMNPVVKYATDPNKTFQPMDHGMVMAPKKHISQDGKTLSCYFYADKGQDNSHLTFTFKSELEIP